MRNLSKPEGLRFLSYYGYLQGGLAVSETEPWLPENRRRDDVGFFALQLGYQKGRVSEAFRVERKVWERPNEGAVFLAYSAVVVAQVEGFGAVMEYEKGWITQGQVVRKLWVPEDAEPEIVRDLERRYQCEVARGLPE